MLTSDLYLEDLKKINEQSLPWKQLENRKVLITGGTGLIGSCFADALIYRNEHLKSNIDLWVLCRSRANAEKVFGNYMGKPYLHFLFQDVSEPVCIQEQMDYIVHAASKGDPKSFVLDPLGVMNANILGMHRVIEYARRTDVKKIVYISSGEVYGKLPLQKSEMISETMSGELDNLNSRNCYGISKRAAETMCMSACTQLEMNITIARLCHVYGPTMMEGENRVIFQFIKNVLNHQAIILKSAGIQKRSYLYVADAVIGILTVLLLGRSGEAYNVSNYRSVITIRELAEYISRYSGNRIVMEAQNEQEQKGNSDIIHAVLDDTKLQKLGIEMQYDMHTGLERTIHILREALK